MRRSHLRAFEAVDKPHNKAKARKQSDSWPNDTHDKQASSQKAERQFVSNFKIKLAPRKREKRPKNPPQSQQKPDHTLCNMLWHDASPGVAIKPV